MKSTESTPRRRKISRFIRILVIWLCALAVWEGAYRVIGWQAWKFPAPSHVVDASLRMLNINTYFGEPLRSGWPMRGPDDGFAPEESEEGVLKSQLVRAILV